MLALLVSFSAAALLGLTAWLPVLLHDQDGVADVPPGLFLPAKRTWGYVTLGRGATVSVYPDGLRVSWQDYLQLQTASGASPVSAVTGSVTGPAARRAEHVRHAYDNARIDTLMVLPGVARYEGTVFDDEGRSLPLRLTVELVGSTVQVLVRVQGADAVVVHLSKTVATLGLPPGLPPVNLRNRAWWVTEGTSGDQPLVTTVLGPDLALGPSRAPRLTDRRHAGRNDLHVWAAQADLGIRLALPAVADSVDARQ